MALLLQLLPIEFSLGKKLMAFDIIPALGSQSLLWDELQQGIDERSEFLAHAVVLPESPLLPDVDNYLK